MARSSASTWTKLLFLGGACAAVYWLERRRPLRRETEPKLRRDTRNLAVAALSAVTIQTLEQPIVGPLAECVERRRWGLLPRLALPRWLKVPLALAALDYTLYLWHVLTHRVPLLWRFHQVHHVDRDLDASTALRFHFGEMALSVPWRSAQVLVLGISPRILALWQKLTLIEVIFHHSNLELPLELERWLCCILVTPRMHGIHHSIVEEETNSNWSSGLTLWDFLHGTLRLNVPQDEITIGVPAYRSSEELTLPRLLAMPFGPQRPSWQLPGDGKPARVGATLGGRKLNVSSPDVPKTHPTGPCRS